MSANLLAANLLPLKAGSGPAPLPRTDRNEPPGGSFRDFFDIRRIRDRADKAVPPEPASKEPEPVDAQHRDEAPAEAPVTEAPVEGLATPVAVPVEAEIPAGAVAVSEHPALPNFDSEKPAICEAGEPFAQREVPQAVRLEAPVFPGGTIGRIADLGGQGGATIGSRGSIDVHAPGQSTVSQVAARSAGDAQPVPGPTPRAEPQPARAALPTSREAAAASLPPTGGERVLHEALAKAPASTTLVSPEQIQPAAPATPVERPKPARNEKAAKLKADPRLAPRGEPRGDSAAPESHRIAPARAAPGIDATGRIERIRISSGRGDGAAASVGKFLISGATESAELTANAGPPSDVTSGASAPSAAPRPAAQPSQTSVPSFQTTLNQLLLAPVPADDVIDAAARVLTASGSGGRQQVTLQLDPPELGHLRLEIRMQQQAMTLRVDAESHAVARLIESRMSELRDALAGHGIKIERSDVVVRAPASAETAMQQDDGSRGQQGQSGAQHETSRGANPDLGGGHRFDTPRGGAHGGSGQADRGNSAPETSDKAVTLPFPVDANESAPAGDVWIDLVA